MASLPPVVVAAFGLTGTAVAFDGGQGTSVRCGDLVLKPGADETHVRWLADLSASVVADGFRLAAPIPSVDGSYVVDGWAATAYEPGEAEPDGRWQEVLDAGRAFHRAVADVGRPSWWDERADRWAVADRCAWGEADSELGARSAPLLDKIRRTLPSPTWDQQLVHGDLSGNVLLHPTLPPAVIDVSPYWRPAAYADAVVVVDALLWWRTDSRLVQRAQPDLDDARWRELLLRALVFRLVALDEAHRPDDAYVRAELVRYGEVLDLLLDADSSP